MNLRTKQSSSSISAYSYYLVFCFFFLSFRISDTQNATTDPSEVKALNSIFQKWDVQAVELQVQWNISGDPCSGAAINDTIKIEEDDNFNPAIKCNCSYNNTCHITKLSYRQRFRWHHVSHSPRASNQAANFLAKMGCNLLGNLVILDDPPGDIISLLDMDNCNG